TALTEAAAWLSFVVVAPPLAYGASREHAGFAGTLSIGTEVLTDALVELVRSARGTSAGVVFVSAHGGNAESIDRAQERCRSEGDRVFAWSPRVAGGDAHAGRTETSLMLAIAPEQVRSDALEPGRAEPLGQLWTELRSRGVRAVSESGVLGDPTQATLAEGRRLLAALAGELIGTLESWWNELDAPRSPAASG
ncbi:MAG: mycofactocin biosynthesis peptidyl-dipeptidase MftE, partial [Actinomycetes bacterium]